MKRYEGEGLEEYPDGDWVKYEDVKKLEDEILELKASLENFLK